MRQFIIILFILLTTTCVGQMKDIGAWTGIKLSQKIDKKAEFTLSQGLRFDNNLSNTSNLFTQFKGTYEILKPLTFSIAYRWAKKNDWNKDFSFENRYQFDLRYKFKKKKFSAKNRLRFQSKYADYRTTEYGFLPENYLRNAVEFNYKVVKKITPFASFEIFYPLNAYDKNIDKLRYQLGSNFEINKRLSAELFFIYENEIYKSDPISSYILGTGFSYELPKIKTKKKKGKKDDEEELEADKKSKVKKSKSSKSKNKSVEPELPANFDEDYD